jgi:uncharacterized protein
MAMQRTVSTQSPVSVTIAAGPTGTAIADSFELQHARQVLAKLKARIGRHGLLKLLAADIKEGDDFLREMAMRSHRVLRPATTVLTVHGLKAAQFLRWLDISFTDESVLLAAEPDHFVMAPNPDSTVMVAENLGPYVCRIYLPAFDAAVNWTAETVNELLPESDYPYRRIADMSLEDGTVVGRMLTQFGDTDDGFTASLTVYFPVTCPEALFEHHRQHLAVEFSNWIHAAATAQLSQSDCCPEVVAR